VSATIASWATERWPEDVERFVRRVERLADVRHVAVMPDVHVAGPACVGVVVATSTMLYPELLGSDLGCGVRAIPLGIDADAIADPAVCVKLLRALSRNVPILRGPGADAGPFMPASNESLDRLAASDGRVELGSVGRGNHFVEVQEARTGELVVLVHSGSRSLGPAVQRFHLARATCSVGSPFVGIDASTASGRAYVHDVAWAMDYARENRSLLESRALHAIGDVLAIAPRIEEVIDRHHDGVERESHAIGEVFVHRKGAMKLRAGERGVIPGSMGTSSFVVVSRGVPEALDSSAHGAGRCVPRGEARHRFDEAALARSMRGVCFDARNSRGLLDEIPEAYKDIRAVLRAQRELVSIDTELVPRIVHKGA